MRLSTKRTLENGLAKSSFGPLGGFQEFTVNMTFYLKKYKISNHTESDCSGSSYGILIF